jgi:predicted CXXCH cytochrome family protein
MVSTSGFTNDVSYRLFVIFSAPMWLCALASLMLVSALPAQEIDTALSTPASDRRITILDQIEDRAERSAFQRISRNSSPAKRRGLALAFVNRYPSSWLLGEVYEIIARASIDLNDLDAAVDYGVRSLRLWPENVLLLAQIAGVEATLQQYDGAEETANRALWCLDRFDRPGSVPPGKWPPLERKLRGSIYFVLGRITASRGLSAAGEQRSHDLDRAAQLLTKALEFDSGDEETLYLAGLVAVASGNAGPAAEYFAEASRVHGALEAGAMKQLQAIYRATNPSVGSSFDRWMGSLKLRVPKSEAGEPPPRPAAQYAGSEACAGCHQREYQSWKQTGMARMLRPYRPEIVSGDFSGSFVFTDSRGAPAVRMFTDRGRHFFSMPIADGAWARYPVDYVIGSKWQQAYATRLPDGRIQVFPIQYNIRSREWVNYWKTIDPSGSSRADVHRFSEELGTATYQTNCAPCHTSQLRFKDAGSQPGSASFAEGGVDCEMCHGPSARHVAAVQAGARGARVSPDTPVDFRRITAAESVAICSQCHLQSGVRTPGKDGAVNYSETGPTFYRVSVSRPYVDFSRQAFYKDGRFRVTTFIVESFVRSKCYGKGAARCESCHDPHPPNAAENPVSLKFAKDSDEMCLQCHATMRAKAAQHARHTAGSEASRCVSCHMPRIMEAVLFSARSHQIDDVPSADMTARFGQQESPNACLLCHRDKDAEWLTAQLAGWRR